MVLSSSNSSFIALTVIAPILTFFAVKFLTEKYILKKYGKRKYHPIGCSKLSQLLNFPRLHHYATDLAAKHKTYRIRDLFSFRNEIYSSDPAVVEYILKTNFDNYGKGSYNYYKLRDLLGDGIFAVDGEKWRDQRKVSSHEFSTKVLRDFSSVIFRENAVKLAHLVAEAANSNRTVDMQNLFMKSTLDSIFKVAFGVELDCMCGTSVEGIRFSEAFDNASSLSVWRYVDVFWPIKKFFNVGSEAKLKKSVAIIDSLVYKLIQKKAEQQNHLPKHNSSTKKDDILSRFLQMSNTDPKYLRDIILNFVIAGKDTTAGALSWFLYMLCRHPEVQEKVAQEIKTSVKAEKITSYDDFAAKYASEESLEKMHYLHAALTETLRLYPSVPVDPKCCFSDDTLPDGFSVNKGDSVAYLPYAMGRMKFLWGDDAEEYRPERWLDEFGNFQPQNPFKFTAFQAGPRICLGKEFAYRQMKIFSAILLGNFIFRLADEQKPVTYRTMLNLHIDGPLNVNAISKDL